MKICKIFIMLFVFLNCSSTTFAMKKKEKRRPIEEIYGIVVKKNNRVENLALQRNTNHIINHQNFEFIKKVSESCNKFSIPVALTFCFLFGVYYTALAYNVCFFNNQFTMPNLTL